MKMYQERSYVIALKEAQDVNGLYIDEEKRGTFFRNVNNFLLIGGEVIARENREETGGSWSSL